MRHVIVVGSTGMVGRALVRELSAFLDLRVTALVRRPGALAGLASRAGDGGSGAGIHEQVFAFDDPGAYAVLGRPEMRCDALFCAIGTTMRTAGSEAAFLRVDRDIPLALLARAREVGTGCFALVSSVGADRPSGFYLRTKAAVEAAVLASGLRYVIARPSLLLGERTESRPGEQVARVLMPPLFAALGGLAALAGRRAAAAVERYAPVSAERVAAALARAALADPDASPRGVVLEGAELR